jgi:hypothetical protein
MMLSLYNKSMRNLGHFLNLKKYTLCERKIYKQI